VLEIRTVLHPTDFSDLSRPAFELACSLARDFGAELVVLYVTPWPAPGVVDGIVVGIPTEPDDELLARLEQVKPDDPRIRTARRLAHGEAAAEIMKAAAEVKADLIVMGTHGRGGLSRLIVGSTAEDVMRKAPCPVLTVKAPHPTGHPAPEKVLTA
jgi:nucleotide-binding universal stress UspA family protein